MVVFLFLIFLNQLIVSSEFFHILYLELLNILATIFFIGFLDNNPNSAFLGLISQSSLLFMKSLLWSLKRI